VATAEEKQTDRQKAEEELRLLYQVTTQDLAFFKKQQWSVTNYVLLLFGAFFGVSQIDALKVGPCERFVLCLVASALAVVGILLVYKLEKSIKARRDRLNKIRCMFTESFCLAWKSKDKAPDSTAIVWLLYLIIGFGAVFLWWFVFAKTVIAP
jgi:hypothetical protein